MATRKNTPQNGPVYNRVSYKCGPQNRDLFYDIVFGKGLDKESIRWFHDLVKIHPHLIGDIGSQMELQTLHPADRSVTLVKRRPTWGDHKKLNQILEFQVCGCCLVLPFFKTKEDLEIILLAI